ncbi:MAG: protein kinase [Polyangiaceae bacterium]|nr:protein kinase [Polyangiaceae bacterium]
MLDTLVTEVTSIAPGTLLAGKLRVIRLIGEGGMGAVYEVEHELTKHRRAVKMLHAQYASMPSVVARFLREASAAGRIGSPHIIETFDAGHLATGEPYIVMEYLDGIPVDSLLRKRGPLPFHEAAEIVHQACDGIQAAHDAGIIHRDLKPENLFLLRGDKVFIKILDFGISKFDPSSLGAVESLTVEGSALGTPYYMSAEQVRGDKQIDARTDVYALGVVLYELLTNVKPFDGETLMELSVRIHEGKYALPSQVRRDLPHEVDELVAKAMAVDRDHRFATVREFSEALRRLQTGQWAVSDATIAFPSSLPPGGVGTSPFGPSALRQDGPSTSAGTLQAQPERAARAHTQRAAGTTGGVGLDSRPPTKSGGSRWLMIGGGAAVAAISLALLVNRALSPSTDAGVDAGVAPESTLAPKAATAPQPTEEKPAPPPAQAIPSAPATGSAPTADAGVPQQPRVSKQPVKPSVTTPSTRARSEGLATDNPFK